jgi:hypothetical protein
MATKATAKIDRVRKLLDEIAKTEFFEGADTSVKGSADAFCVHAIDYFYRPNKDPLPSDQEVLAAETALAIYQNTEAKRLAGLAGAVTQERESTSKVAILRATPARVAVVDVAAAPTSKEQPRTTVILGGELSVPAEDPLTFASADASQWTPGVAEEVLTSEIAPSAHDLPKTEAPKRPTTGVSSTDASSVAPNGSEPIRADLTRATEGWAKPLGLTEVFGPAFPLHTLCGWHQRFVTELAEQVQIAPDAAAVASLGLIGAAAVKTALVYVQQGDVHRLNTWTLSISAPSDGKTPLLEELRRPFDLVQATLREGARAVAARAATEKRITELELSKLQRQAAASTDPVAKQELTSQATELRSQLDRRRGGLPTLTTGDCTQTALISLMERNNERLALLSDEGDQLFSKIRQRAKVGAEDIADMLKAYSGATITNNSAHREISVPGAALSIVAATQPGPFAKVMGVSAFHSTGFLGRFAFVLPRSLQGARKQRRKGLSVESLAAYHSLVVTLLECPIPEVPTALTLSEAAFQAFAEFGAAADREITATNDRNFGLWLGKLRGLIARIAGILHLSDPAESPRNVISEDTMIKAGTIGRYLSEHARVAYERSEQAALDEEPRRLLKWIQAGRRQVFEHAEVVASFSGRVKAPEIDVALQRLIGANYLREHVHTKGGTGRPRKPSYTVNPYVFLSDD